ncbi:trehalose-6-phosphate synthase [Altererythrobacter sp.]|uniref:alpha,alpha-trehalose-phosphate synthase (UDP-forming) n=1 Tax=Altererythrobacter sp. TaxID=1872480 RepID=UPI001B14D341|nr:trehalose-6-phosphate synthase [Altererythrobacter sp.]MBO6609549.1 trehalose-6-phosphate synthase [Altererythrobacter sp.]MBO6641836.1 trehalose-6-phosphate synthase [Altererythrobacter sp.]MBO6709776.1 trehalose-6-phosphate synthase [Altererythrobacter sp.]
MTRLVVISNRVAVPKARGVAGAQGGLAGALNSALKDYGGIWFGWSGEESEDRTGNINLQRNNGVTTATIDLSTRDVDEYYNGYANSTLWPLFHYRLDLTEYERETGKGYERVNERFAECVTPLIEEDDLVWVHDYHLLPLGERLRSRGLKNRIGFFLHIPWPPARLFVSLPYHERLVRTMLEYDLIGFQTEEWLESFLHYCRKELGADVDENSGQISFEGRNAIARAYPIGIDWEHFQAQGAKEEAKVAEKRLLSSTRDRTAMIGVDRLDYSKGLPERIDGIGRFFDQHPERVRDLVFIQIAPPSREDVESYQKIRTELEQKTGQINGARSEVDLVPIRYVNHGYSHAELYGFFRASKIGLVTPLRDGMNLVAKEYVAAQDPDDPGVLILSRFAGAAHQLGDAVLVNPHSPDDLSHAIRVALDMPLEERKARYLAMIDTIRDDNVQDWTKRFCEDLKQTGD